MENLNHSLFRLWHHLSVRRRWQFLFLLILMLLSSFAEFVSIGAVLPFLSILAEPDRIFYQKQLHIFFKNIGINSPNQLLLPITLFFVFSSLVSGALRIFLLRASSKLAFSTGADLSSSIYRRTLYQSYTNHVSRNSSEVISGIASKANNVIYFIISPFLTLVSSTVLLIFILIALIIVDPIHSISIFGGFGLIYICIVILTRNKLIRDGEKATKATNYLIKTLQEGLGGIRDILIDGTQEYFCEIYKKIDVSLRRAQGNILFIGSFPRYAIETLAIIFLAIFAYLFVVKENALIGIIPVLGVVAIAAQKMLPLLQQVYNSWASLQSGKAALEDTLILLEQSLPHYSSNRKPILMKFKKKITFKDISFRYHFKETFILSKINFEIERGKTIGFIGPTGSGKSTLLDIIMGLLNPSIGEIMVDGVVVGSQNFRGWQTHLAHVPQSIFLSDATIAENIAFGIDLDLIDYGLVKKCARAAQIDLEIEGLVNKYQTMVGERGVRLSGGQRQRIGIARALYKKANILILDEATSALDGETEDRVMKSIEDFRKQITLLIVAHRISTLKNCDQIFEIKNGIISEGLTYQEILSRSV